MYASTYYDLKSDQKDFIICYMSIVFWITSYIVVFIC